MAELKNSNAMSKLLGLLNSPKMAAEIGQMLAQTASELADAYAERDHLRKRLQVAIAETKILAACVLVKAPDRRLVIRKADMLALPGDLELFYENPEPGVKIYALRPRDAPPASEAKAMDLKDVVPAGNA